MVIWIAGNPCAGKSTMVKNIIEDKLSNGHYRPVDTIRCTKFDKLLVVGGTYFKKVVSPGLDGDQRGSKKILNDNFKKLIIQEYPKNQNILCETASRMYFNKDLLYWLIDNFEFKMFYLKTDKTILDERAKIRNNWWDKLRTDKRTIKEVNYVKSIVSDEKITKHIKELKNDIMCDNIKNVKIISNFME